jgi:hypothetical protein
VKYDTNGARKWLRTYDGGAQGYDGARALVVDGTSNTIVTGESQGPPSTGYDCTTIKYDTNGQRLWTRRYDGGYPEPFICDDRGYDIALSPNGSLYVLGASYFSNTASGAFGNTSLVRYTPSGGQLSVRHYPVPSPALDYIPVAGVAVDPLNRPRIAGTVWNGSLWAYDIFTARYTP